ncbi:hypothetical protein TSAR_012308 [Trichomalopsis sarcophagae]|uniref:Uncharacterized protein n=1 Tax=Trichomalopsis sarcophagae TaxID=543379 RepID=A0A232EJJ0_9HYME|nr:hypothetical protein TSAR_012308 [Trichomalopsis sarcophagae]
MCINTIKVLEERFNSRASELKMVSRVKSCLGLKIVKNHENLGFLRK